MKGDLPSRFERSYPNVMLVIMALLLLRLGSRLWTAMIPMDWPSIVILGYVFMTATGLMVLALLDVDLERWGYHIAAWVVFVVLTASLALLLLWRPEFFGTDAMIFARYATDLFVAGENPYQYNMADSRFIYGVPGQQLTPKIDGTLVNRVSYPAGSFVVFAPQVLIGKAGSTLAPTTVFLTAVALIFLTIESPPQHALVPAVVFVGSRNLFFVALGGVIDIIWVLPLLFGMAFWARDRLIWAAVFVGIACGIKQQAWMITPFLAVWLYSTAASYRHFLKRAGVALAAGMSAFLAFNLPFILADPWAWAYGVLTPMSPDGIPLVTQGTAFPAQLTVSGLYPLPNSYYGLLFLAWIFVCLAIYALYFEKLAWAAWVAPAVLLLFNYRTLNSYYYFVLPLAYYALLQRFRLTPSQYWKELYYARLEPMAEGA